MKLIKALQNVDKSTSYECDYEDLCSALGRTSEHIDYDKYSEGLKSYFFRRWVCTDTFVGESAFYLFDKLVGYSIKTYGKATTEFFFLTKDLAEEVNNFVTSCETTDNSFKYELLSVQLSELDIGDFYTIPYAKAYIDKDCIYENEPAKIIRSIGDSEYTHKELQILKSDGSTVIVPTEHITFKYKVTK